MTADDSWRDSAAGPVAAAVAAGRPVTLVWQNQAGGLTFEIGAGGGRCFLKWTPVSSEADLSAEAARMRWAARYTPVPEVLAEGADDAGSWLVTTPLPGLTAIAPRWLADPRAAVTAIGEGLRALHDTLPAATCPFSWSAESRFAVVHQRAVAGQINVAGWRAEHQPLGLPRALELVADIPPVDEAVVCHGDSCAPNTLITDDGRWSGHVDLGFLGVADRWADLAIATWSCGWNYGPGWEGLLLDAYGVTPDPDRTRYYRLLMDLGP